MTARPPDPTVEPLTAIADSVRELVEPARHAERFEEWDERTRRHMPSRLHWTRHPSLLDQLRAAGTAGRGGEDGPTGGYESRPAARLAATDRLIAIEQAVDDWLVRRMNTYGQRISLEQNLRLLVGSAADLDKPGRLALQRETARWVTWARVVAGWDSEPWRPNAACPMCEQTGGLRIRLDERVATCLDCGEAWDSATLSLLADHIRGINAEQEDARRAVAQLAKDLTNYFPRRGPCLLCGVKGEDARHRVIDAVVDRVLAGEDPGLVAWDFDLPADAVLVAVAWATHPVQQLERARQETSA